MGRGILNEIIYDQVFGTPVKMFNTVHVFDFLSQTTVKNTFAFQILAFANDKVNEDGLSPRHPPLFFQ